MWPPRFPSFHVGNPECEKYLGVFIDSTLKFEHYIATAIKEGNEMAGLVWRTFEYVEEEMCRALYKTMVRSHLEYATPVWSPQCGLHNTRKLAEALLKVQRRATKRIPSLARLGYEDRLRKLKLPTLMNRWVSCPWNKVTGQEDIEWS